MFIQLLLLIAMPSYAVNIGSILSGVGGIIKAVSDFSRAEKPKKSNSISSKEMPSIENNVNTNSADDSAQVFQAVQQRLQEVDSNSGQDKKGQDSAGQDSQQVFKLVQQRLNELDVKSTQKATKIESVSSQIAISEIGNAIPTNAFEIIGQPLQFTTAPSASLDFPIGNPVVIVSTLASIATITLSKEVTNVQQVTITKSADPTPTTVYLTAVQTNTVTSVLQSFVTIEKTATPTSNTQLATTTSLMPQPTNSITPSSTLNLKGIGIIKPTPTLNLKGIGINVF